MMCLKISKDRIKNQKAHYKCPLRDSRDSQDRIKNQKATHKLLTTAKIKAIIFSRLRQIKGQVVLDLRLDKICP